MREELAAHITSFQSVLYGKGEKRAILKRKKHNEFSQVIKININSNKSC